MRVCSFRLSGETRVRCGVVEGDEVVELEIPTVIDLLAADLEAPRGRHLPFDVVTLLAPVPRPPAIRDFFVFEQHVATARAKRGLDVPSFWYEEPVFYFTNPSAVIAPGEELAYPEGTAQLDYELELAAVVGAGGQIAGFMIMNDWSARDVQRRENSVGLGPAKAKDFATTLGPVIVTVDEFDGTSGLMAAEVNGIGRSSGRVEDMHFTWEDIRERAARNTQLVPGDVLGSGTVGSGCILESDGEDWLTPGDVVTMSIEGLGHISNAVVARRTPASTGSA